MSTTRLGMLEILKGQTECFVARIRLLICFINNYVAIFFHELGEFAKI